MIEFFSPAVLAAVLRVSSSPIYSVHLAMASVRTLRAVPGDTVSEAAGRYEVTGEGARHV
ncbi:MULTISPECIES: hypothetical protein [Paraburkholderia]|jgi:hypothetical protein|uniref:Uncharacterized protein n=1 Tax=Paraburkholderia aspalathi TaxID=1324617 RepID=A0A1I7EI93_9BURK|nr:MULTISPECIES: hypothetical protein [Paraburkholderia]MCP2090320.1 hypothetical protein [Paraburkholderia sediminicola]MBK3838002.1 hypothetical protein [Paraburkholderia aspalathi]MCX4153951.1 hypothetical protein [Paraburkholderia aspalathi]MDN7163366.1 hypothetical protein [Paraburkholderia sp. SECH2]MDQ6391851.1 hypothetical protein [Paraburkholderia aspalathi]